MLRPYEQANIEPLFMRIETSQFHSLSVIFSGGRSGELHISGFYFKFLDEIVTSLSSGASEKMLFFQSVKSRPGPTSGPESWRCVTSELGFIRCLKG
jgi:hypothetical protein